MRHSTEHAHRSRALELMCPLCPPSRAVSSNARPGPTDTCAESSVVHGRTTVHTARRFTAGVQRQRCRHTNAQVLTAQAHKATTSPPSSTARAQSSATSPSTLIIVISAAAPRPTAHLGPQHALSSAAPTSLASQERRGSVAVEGSIADELPEQRRGGHLCGGR